MDTTFYDESSRFRAREDVKMIKRPMTLDLDSVKPSKKHRGGPVVLTSPDYNKCTLGSPDLVKFLTEGSDGMVTTTPSPNQCMYLKNSQDDQQEQYVREFASVPAQNHHSINNGAMYPHQQQQMGPEMGNNVISSAPCSIMPSSVNPMEQSYTPYPSAITTSCSSMAINQGPVTTSGMGNCYAPVSNCYYGIPQPVSIKEEPQTVPCMGGSPPLSPIDMEEQERVKLERKRLRNRIAASKCRRRKLERIAKLEDKVFALKNQNSELTNIVTTLREQVCQLKQQVLDHVRSGCELMMSQF